VHDEDGVDVKTMSTAFQLGTWRASKSSLATGQCTHAAGSTLPALLSASGAVVRGTAESQAP
jgi:hypothetical protein